MKNSETPVRNVSQAQLFSLLGDLVKVCGTDSFPVRIKCFFESFCEVSEFAILTFQKNVVPIPIFTAVSGVDKSLALYCNGLYLLDPYYDHYVKNNLHFQHHIYQIMRFFLLLDYKRNVHLIELSIFF